MPYLSTAIFHRQTGDTVDEIQVVTLDGLYYWARRERDGNTESSPKIDGMSLADTLAFCGYVRQP